MNSKATVYRFSELPVDCPSELIERRRVIGEQMMISHVTLQQGFHVPNHSHDNEQIAVVISGRMRFSLVDSAGNESEQVLGAGEVLLLPAGVVHGATAEETSVLLDLFSPISETTGVDTARKNP